MTSTYDDLGLRYERDAFDTLFDHAPDKLQVVKKVGADGSEADGQRGGSLLLDREVLFRKCRNAASAVQRKGVSTSGNAWQA